MIAVQHSQAHLSTQLAHQLVSNMFVNHLTTSNRFGNGNINSLLDSNPGPMNPFMLTTQHGNAFDSRFYYSTSHSQLSSSTSTSSFTVNDEERALIKDLTSNPQTSVSLQKLISTGLGEYLHKTFGDDIIASSTSSKVLMGSTTTSTLTSTTDQNITPEKLVLIQVASFLRRELPIRLAHRIEDLESIPVLRDMEHVVLVRNLYIQSCLDIVRFDTKITTVQQEQEFSLIIEKIYERHNSVLVQMARGAYEFRKTLQKNQNNNSTSSTSSVVDLQDETNEFLDRFYLCRIGIRVLIGQYLALRQPPVDNYIGIVCSRTSPYEIVKRAIDDAAFMCTRKYGEAPEVIMSGRLDLTFPYVPTHLRKFNLLLRCLVSVVMFRSLGAGSDRPNDCFSFIFQMIISFVSLLKKTSSRGILSTIREKSNTISTSTDAVMLFRSLMICLEIKRTFNLRSALPPSA